MWGTRFGQDVGAMWGNDRPSDVIADHRSGTGSCTPNFVGGTTISRSPGWITRAAVRELVQSRAVQDVRVPQRRHRDLGDKETS